MKSYEKWSISDLDLCIQDQNDAKKEIDDTILIFEELKEFTTKFYKQYDQLLWIASNEYDESVPLKFIILDTDKMANRLNEIFLKNKFRKHLYFNVYNNFKTNIIITKHIEDGYIESEGILVRDYRHLIKCLDIFLNEKEIDSA